MRKKKHGLEYFPAMPPMNLSFGGLRFPFAMSSIIVSCYLAHTGLIFVVSINDKGNVVFLTSMVVSWSAVSLTWFGVLRT